MSDCVFCNLVSRVIDRPILFEDDFVIVVNDILPKAPVHMQVIAKKHIVSIAHVTDADRELLADMIMTAKTMAEKRGINESGYKLVINVGKEGGQVIPHLHMHVLGGKQFPE